jgi:NADH dehydrogenase
MAIHELPPFAEADGIPSNHVVIAGAGYGGLRCAQALSKYLDEPGAPEVVLLDRFGYHQIITELPVAAGGRIGADEVSIPLDRLLENTRIRFEQADIRAINPDAKLIQTTRGNLTYGVLVIALGSITAFFGVPGLVEHALTLKSVEDAEAINIRVREAIRQAAATTDHAARAALLSFLIGGAGLTGVELAGELAEVLPGLAREHGLAKTEPRVTLLEGSPFVLPSMPERLRTRGAGILTDLGVRLVLGSKVVGADENGITLASGDRLVGSTLVWTGGIMAPPILAQSGLPTAANGQIPVDEYLRVDGHQDVYVIGDAARVRDASGHGALEPTAQVAVKQAEAAAYNIVAEWHGWQQRPYAPVDKGQAVSLGSAKGVASIFHVSLTGRKVIALKTLIEEAYRYSVTGKLGRARKAQPEPASP